MLKRLTALLIAALLAVPFIFQLPGALALSVYDENEYNGLEYEIIDGNAIITGYTDAIAKDQVIPDTIAGAPVTEIAEGAFEECYAIESVAMPSVKKIGNQAFGYCSALKSVTIPEGVTSIGTNPFVCCNKLTSLNVSDGNNSYSTENGALYNKDKTLLISYPSASGEVTVKNGVAVIGENAFEQCAITSVVLPDVTSINSYAFNICTELLTISMPKAGSIGNSAFHHCDKLTTVSMPGAAQIGQNAFSYCGTLRSVDMPKASDIGVMSFGYCTGLKTINIPASLTNICAQAFAGCTALAEFSVDEANKQYSSENGVLYNKNKTAIVSYPSATGEFFSADSVTEIGESAMYDCAITAATLNNVTKIGANAFEHCSKLASVSMPAANSVGDKAFRACVALGSVSIPASVNKIGVNPFVKCAKLSSINVASENTEFLSDGHTLYNKQKSIIISCPTAKGAVEALPSVTEIRASAFEETEVKSVNLPEVTVIGESAFSWCIGLAEASVPKCVTVSASAFASTTLTTAALPCAKSIGDAAFYNCDIKSVEIPVVTVIQKSAFDSCEELVSIELPSVCTMGDFAFHDCDALILAKFFSDAPKEFGVGVFDDCADEFLISYCEGLSGWTSPLWNGYKTQAFVAENCHKVVFVDGITNEAIVSRFVQDKANAVFPEVPVHFGYLFLGWSADGIEITEDTTITANYEAHQVKGDVNGDGEMNTGDAVLVLKYTVGSAIFIPEQEVVADHNADGSINTGDAVAILKDCVK